MHASGENRLVPSRRGCSAGWGGRWRGEREVGEWMKKEVASGKEVGWVVEEWVIEEGSLAREWVWVGEGRVVRIWRK